MCHSQDRIDEEKARSEKHRPLNEMDGLCPGSYCHFLEPGSLPMDKPEKSHFVFCTAWTNNLSQVEFVRSPFLNYGITAEHQIMPMSSFFYSKASMNSVVPAGSCHRAYILMPIPESCTVSVFASDSYLIRIPYTFRIEGTRTYLRKRNAT